MKCRGVCSSHHAEQSWNLAGTRTGGRRYRGTTIGSVRRLLTLGQPHRNTAIKAHLQDRRPLALVVTLVLCLFAFVVLSSNEAWAKEQPSSTEQSTGESTIIVNGTQVATPTPMPMPPPVSTTPSTTPPVETPLNETLPQPPSNSVLFKAEP